MGSDVTTVYSSEFLVSELLQLGDAARGVLALGIEAELLGDLLPLAMRSDDVPSMAGHELVRLSLFADALYVAERVVSPEDPSDAEASYVLALTHAAAPSFRALGRAYASPTPLSLDDARWFLAGHRADTGLFGHGSGTTRWFGLDIMRRLGEEMGDDEKLELYLTLMGRLADEIDALDDFRGTAERVRSEMLARAHPAYETPERPSQARPIDARVVAFCTRGAREVFECVCHGHQVWRRDPLDVDSVHAEARAVFSELLECIAREGEKGRGRVLLVLGEAGSGKTHLLRAFRERVHGRRSGYAAYLQAAPGEDVAEQLLMGLIASLESPYDEPAEQVSSLERLADTLLHAPFSVTPAARDQLRDARLDDRELPLVVAAVADAIVEDPRFSDLDIDLLRVLLVLTRREPRLKARALKYLRGDELAPHDMALLGHPAPHRPGGARSTLSELARLVARLDGGALVILIDQLEDLAHGVKPVEQLVRLLDELRRFVDHTPNGLVVITCARDFYVQSKAYLDPAIVDRLERDPEPEQLVLGLGLEELEAVITRRLAVLMQAQGARFDALDPTNPLPSGMLEGLEGHGLREALDHVAQYRARCIATGRMVSAESVALARATRPPPSGPLLGAQYQLHRNLDHPPAERPEQALAQLADALRIASRDLGLTLDVRHEDGRIDVTATPPATFHFGVGAGDLSPVLVRELAAFQSFATAHGHEPAFWTWVRAEKPLLKLPGILPMLGLSSFPGQSGPPRSAGFPELGTPVSGIIARNSGPARGQSGSE